MNTIVIAIVDDDEDLRYSLIDLLELSQLSSDDGIVQEIKCIGFKNGIEFMKYAEQSLPLDVVILDMEMPELDGLGVLEVCKTLGFKFNFLLFSNKFNYYNLKASEEYSIKGYINKPSRNDKFIDAIKIAIEGGTFISPYCSNVFETIKKYKSKPNLQELEIAFLASKGMSLKEIAYKLQVTEETVKSNKKRLKDKLGVDTFQEALELTMLDKAN